MLTEIWRTWKLCTSEISLGKSFQFRKRNPELPNDLACQLAFHRYAKIHENNERRKNLLWLNYFRGCSLLSCGIITLGLSRDQTSGGKHMAQHSCSHGNSSKQRQEGTEGLHPLHSLLPAMRPSHQRTPPPPNSTTRGGTRLQHAATGRQ